MFSFQKKWNTVSQSDDRHSTMEEESNSSFSEFNSTFDHAPPSPQQQQQSSTDYSSIRVFEMESDHDLPAIITNIPSPSVSSTSSHSTVRQSSSKPIDIKYFVPRNTEPEGLSQSVIISDHDYIHRQLLKRYQMSYDEHESLPHNSLAENNMECSHDDDSHYSSESHVNNFFSDDRSSAKMVTSLLSKSVPLLSSMSSYHKFAWSKLTPPNQDYLPSELPCPNEKYQKESNVDAGVVTVKGNRNTLESNDIDEEPDSNSLEEWINAANQRFGKITVEEKKDLEKRLGAVFSKTPWDRAHEDPCALERLKQNPFIHVLFQRYSVPMKVTNIARNARFKQIQYHFHNPSVLYMRYIRNTQTVFVIYRCYAEMIKAVRVMDSTEIAKHAITCRPSNADEFIKECSEESKRKLKRKKIRGKKFDNQGKIKTKKLKNKKPQVASKKLPSHPTSKEDTYQTRKRHNAKKDRQQPFSKTGRNERYNDKSCVSSSYYYQCYCYQCTNSTLLYTPEK